MFRRLLCGSHAYNMKMYAEILARLEQIEKDEDVTIFYACESGSRAWGFPSADSDYDVRFIYVRPRDWYLSIDVEEKRDVIERPINDALDISGWDLRKALKLLRKSNPPLLEWLSSPIVYKEQVTSPKSCATQLPNSIRRSRLTIITCTWPRGITANSLRVTLSG